MRILKRSTEESNAIGGGVREHAAPSPTSDSPAPVRRPWAATAERMRRLAADHADAKVRIYAAQWLAARGEPAA